MKSHFLIASLAYLAIVISCSPAHEVTNKKKTNQDYYIIQTNQIKWCDVLKQEDNQYIVFIYSETCGYCHDMLDEIVDFANLKILPTYFVNCSQDKVPISNDYSIGITDIEQLSIKGTPSIIEVNEKMVAANIPGSDQCLTYLNDKRIETNINL